MKDTRNNGAPLLIERGGLIKCPQCGVSCDMHPTKVEVWFRRGEASRVGDHVVVDDKLGVTLNHNAEKNNPSLYRDGLRIWFLCTYCDTSNILVMQQHKGPTYVEWERDLKTKVVSSLMKPDDDG